MRLKRFLAHNLKRWVSYMKLEYMLHHPPALCASLLNHILRHMHINTNVYTHTHSLCRCLCNSMNLQLCAVYRISAVCLTAYKINWVFPVSQLFVLSLIFFSACYQVRKWGSRSTSMLYLQQNYDYITWMSDTCFISQQFVAFSHIHWIAWIWTTLFRIRATAARGAQDRVWGYRSITM